MRSAFSFTSDFLFVVIAISENFLNSFSINFITYKVSDFHFKSR